MKKRNTRMVKMGLVVTPRNDNMTSTDKMAQVKKKKLSKNQMKK